MKRALLVVILSVAASLSGLSQIDINATGSPYWAIGDGATDDTAALQQAIDTAAQAGGGCVIIPAGVYLVTNSLVIGSNTRITGSGRHATIIRARYTAGFPGGFVNGAGVYATMGMVAASNSTIAHLTVDNYSLGFPGNGIELVPDGAGYTGTPCCNCSVVDCEVLGTNTHQYLIWNLKGRHTKILNNYCTGNATAPGGQEGIESFGGDDVLIQGNTVEHVGDACINLGPALGMAGADTRNITVANNFCRGANIGVHTGAVNDSAFGPQILAHVHVKDNVILDCFRYGLDLQAQYAGTQISDLQISGNTISNCAVSVFIYGDPGLAMEAVKISGNAMQHSTTTQEGGLASISRATSSSRKISCETPATKGCEFNIQRT